MVEYLDIEALDKLIKSVQKYQEDLKTNYEILINAYNIVDTAMGSGIIANKKIYKMHEALSALQIVTAIAENVAIALMDEKMKVLEIYESI